MTNKYCGDDCENCTMYYECFPEEQEPLSKADMRKIAYDEKVDRLYKESKGE